MILSTGLFLSEKDEGIMSRIMVTGTILECCLLQWNNYNIISDFFSHCPSIFIFKGVKFSELVMSVIFLQTIVHVIQTSIEIFIMYYVFNNPISMDNFWTFVIIMMIIGYQGMFAGKFKILKPSLVYYTTVEIFCK